MFVNTTIWGPMFILGILSLSDYFKPATALYIQYVLSNLYIPAYLYGTFKMWESAVWEETWNGFLKWGLYLFVNLITLLIQIIGAKSAQYWLLEDLEYTDTMFVPSLFYTLGSNEHTLKSEGSYYYN